MSSAYWMMGALLFLSAPYAIPAQQPISPQQDANRAVVVGSTDVAGVVDRLAKRTGDFKAEFDKEVEHTMDGKHVEERAKRRADDLHDAAKKLKDVFGDKRDKNAPQVRQQVDKVLAAGSEVSRVVGDHRFTDRLQRDWDLLRSDLNALADVYQLTPIA